MTTLATVPALPVPNRPVSVTFGLAHDTADFIRVWCVTAPIDSSLDKRLNSSTDPRNRVTVFEGSPNTAWTFTFDKGGRYNFFCQEYRKGAGYGGGYVGDPNSVQLEDKLGSETLLSIYVGQRLTQPIGPPADQATLVVWVWNDRIQPTTKAFHGETSPAITATAQTPRVRTAIESTAVIAALAALAGSDLTAADTIGDLTSWTANLWAAFSSHFPDGAHANADSQNVPKTTFRDTPDRQSYIASVNEMLKLLRQHVTNDTGTADAITGAFGPDSAHYHMSGSANVSDRSAISLFQSVSTYEQAYGALVDLFRCLKQHVANLVVHSYAQSVTYLDLTLVMKVHEAFLTVLANSDSPTPAAQSTGAQHLIDRAGFTES